MPTVLWLGNLRVMIRTNDHSPPHVHVVGNAHEAKFALNCPRGPVTLVENYGFSLSEVTRIKQGTQKNVVVLCNAWEKIHGQS
jgi:hypothetical protein